MVDKTKLSKTESKLKQITVFDKLKSEYTKKFGNKNVGRRLAHVVLRAKERSMK